MVYSTFIIHMDELVFRIANRLRIRHTLFSRNELLLRRLRRGINDDFIRNYQYPTKIEPGNTIWIFWAQGKDEMPEIVRKCLDSIIRNKGDYKVVLLNMKNLGQYINIPSYIYRKHNEGSISFAHFSDIVRFTLLSTYGGYYLDATIFLTRPLLIREQLFTIKQNYSDNFISHNQWTGFFWYTWKCHPLACFIRDYLYNYWKTNNIIFDYFFVDYLIRIFYEKNIDFRKEIDSINYNNPDLYFFQSSECEKVFDSDKWDNISKNTSIFKLNWKSSSICEIEGHDTFYGMLKKGLLVN